MMNVAGADVPPLAPGVKTVIDAVPEAATSDAAIDATSFDALENVVARSAPFHRTVDVDANELPFTVRLNAPLPATTDDGDNDEMTGAELEPDSTVTTGLVAVLVNPPLGKYRNSYVPGVVGMVTVHARVVTPLPT
jgi:hypothetical protein